jgi:pyruvate formate lyase activating enzyme
LVGERRTVAQVLAPVERDLLFYDQSGGGLTLSGGEPLGQPGFALAALREAKRVRIPTAVDTCGHAAPEIIEEASRCADLFLYDLKLMDERRHAEATGLGNELILDNVRRLGSLGARVWIRFPLIPGVNGDEEDVAAIGRFVRGLRGVEAIQVLPYHRAGEAKRDRLERPLDGRRFDVPTPEVLDRTAAVLRREARRPVTIGG